jgi:hypothetical protein
MHIRFEDRDQQRIFVGSREEGKNEYSPGSVSCIVPGRGETVDHVTIQLAKVTMNVGSVKIEGEDIGLLYETLKKMVQLGYI